MPAVVCGRREVARDRRRVAVGLGSHARHRVGVGGAGWPRLRVAAPARDRRAGARGRALPAVAAARVARRSRSPGRRSAAPRERRPGAPASDLRGARGPGRAALPGARRRPARADAARSCSAPGGAWASRCSRCASWVRRRCWRCRPRSSTSSRPGAPTSAGSRFDDLRRAQLDLETTGLDPEVDRIFLIALRGPTGAVDILEAARRRRRGRGGPAAPAGPAGSGQRIRT